ncbi:MAG: DUF1127 domain-containing protein [Acidiferrobacterales bacterium]
MKGQALLLRVNVVPATLPRSRFSLAQFAKMLLEWHERARQRQALLALDDRLLKDIGISRADAEIEGNKPFWRP